MITPLYILTKDFLFPSSRILRNELSSIIGGKVVITKDPNKITGKTFIRYGNSDDTEEDTEYNSADFIRFCSNKLAFSHTMKANKIPSPIYYRNEPNKFPVLIRQYISAHGGKGILVAKNMDIFRELWKNHFYWTPFLNIKFELRAHILGGNLVKLFRKEEGEEIDLEFPIRNNANCHFSLKDIRVYPKLHDFFEKFLAIDEIKMGRFFSADLGWDNSEKQYTVFEINSASGLNENTAKLYAEYLAKELFNVTTSGELSE